MIDEIMCAVCLLRFRARMLSRLGVSEESNLRPLLLLCILFVDDLIKSIDYYYNYGSFENRLNTTKIRRIINESKKKETLPEKGEIIID